MNTKFIRTQEQILNISAKDTTLFYKSSSVNLIWSDLFYFDRINSRHYYTKEIVKYLSEILYLVETAF